jgi:hypothetical protein
MHVQAEELVPVYAALFVAVMGLDMTDVAITIPGVRLADIRRVSRLLQDGRDVKGNGGVINLGVPRKEGVHDRDADA